MTATAHADEAYGPWVHEGYGGDIMDPFRSLSDYDLLAHIPQGFLAFAAVDYIFGSNVILGRPDWDIGYGTLIVILSYIAGHLIAGAAQFVLEKGLAKGLLGGSPQNLLAHSKRSSHWSKVFPEYFEQAGYPTRTSVLGALGISDPTAEASENAFWSAYGAAREDEYTRGRLKTFLNLYGFCRNVAFLGFVVAAGVIIHSAVTMNAERFISWPSLLPIVLILLSSFLMCQRYLKFYRLYALEVFIAFRRASPPASLPDRQGKARA